MSKIKKLLFALMFLVLILPVGANAACICDPLGIFCFPPGCSGGGGGDGFNLDNISGMGLPSGSIFGIIENIAYWILGIFAFFGVIGFVVSGIMYLISAGDDDMISKAKKYMMYSMVGVIVGLMGLVIIQAAFYMLGGSSF
jgi:hypothetical protein